MLLREPIPEVLEILRDGADLPADTDVAPEHSEDSLALKFTARHQGELRYVAAWNKWMRWDGRVWHEDEILNVFDKAREICRAAASETEHPSTAMRLARAQTVAAVEHLARCDRRHAARVDQWDADPWALNTPDGVVDLRTGTLRPPDPKDYLTKITATAPGGDCPLWQRFLDRVIADDPMQGFVQRMCGYALSGSTREHALFFLYGTGANGKSVFIRTTAGILGDYATTAPIDTFTASRNESHPTDIAGLRGARLVSATETEDGRRWNESKLKILTGGDTLSARKMRQDFFEFTPIFKLMIAGNHKPGLRTVDEAMRRRFHLLPFTQTIDKDERDVELAEKLRQEWPGILSWMIQGCLEWQRGGLAAPLIVRQATDAYLASEDTLERWLEDECVRQSGCWTATAALFRSWTEWCERNNEHAGSQRKFSDGLQMKGFEAKRTKAARGHEGIGLRQDQ